MKNYLNDYSKLVIIVFLTLLSLLGLNPKTTNATTSSTMIIQQQPAQTAVLVPMPPTAVTVLIQNLTFNPSQIAVNPGTTITWVNQDSVDHTVTADDANGMEFWDSGIIPPGESFSKTFNRSGSFSYRCNMHPTMAHGTVQVLGASQIVQVGQAATPAPTPIPVLQLPTTGAPIASILGVVAIVILPLGLKLARFDRIKKMGLSTYNLWYHRKYRQPQKRGL